MIQIKSDQCASAIDTACFTVERANVLCCRLAQGPTALQSSGQAFVLHDMSIALQRNARTVGSVDAKLRSSALGLCPLIK